MYALLYMWVALYVHVTSRKNQNSPPRKSKKQIQFNHWPFISGCACPGTQVLTYCTEPEFCGKFESELRSWFRAGNGELNFQADLPSWKVFGSGRGCCSSRKPVRLGKSAWKYPRISWNVCSGVSGTGNPNMKLVLVWHPGTESYPPPFLKHRNLLTLRSGPGTRNGVQIRTPRKILGR